MSDPSLRDPLDRERMDTRPGAMRPVDRSPWLIPAMVLAALAMVALLFFAVGDNRTAGVAPDSTTGQSAPTTTPGGPGTPPRR